MSPHLLTPHTLTDTKFCIQISLPSLSTFNRLTLTALLALLFLSPSAPNTDGTIDAAYPYAWSENAGWIGFGSSTP